MKIILLSSLAGLTLPLFANEAKLVMVSATAGLPEGVTFNNRHGYYDPAIELTFGINAKNLISFDRESLVADGWKIGKYPAVSKDGNQAIFSIIKEGNFSGKINTLKVAGSITLNIADKIEEVTVAATFIEEQKIGPYTVQLKIEANLKGEQVVVLKGDVNHIKEVTVKQDGKVLISSASRRNNKQHEHFFKNVKDGALVSIKYQADKQKITYKFSK